MKDSTIINDFSNLKKIREERKITQIKLSTDLGVSQELISRYEIGSSFPQPNMLIRLSQYFNCSVDYLLGLTDIPTPIKYLLADYNNEDYEFINKYNQLSNEDKLHIDSYISFLLNNYNNKNNE